ncbi:MAG TPA: hypothetical protein VL049_18250, partial [Candidatus Dormibacteraeota bacterium]|nr:hypothetical protein [Candidatus Dormibacteraeota bacterium]
ARALQQLGDWGTALATISEGLHMAAQIGQRSWASILRSEEASLSAEAFAFDAAAAIAREELAQPSLPSIARHRAMVELGGALLGLGQLAEAYAALTMPELLRASETAAITFPEQVRLRHGLAQMWSARGDLERARREAESLNALVATADEPAPRALAAGLLAEIALQEGRVSDAEAHLRQAAEAIAGCEAPGLEWHLAAAAAGVYERQDRGADAEAARMRSAAIMTRLADSLPPTHPLRASFLGHSSVRAVLRPRGPMSRSRRRSRP